MAAPGDVIGPVDMGPVAHGGHFVARFQGRVIFVRHTLPGEQVMVRLTDVSHDRFWRGDATQILRTSPDRVEPPCPVAGVCGGCDFQHVTPEAQRRLKADVVAEQLSRLAGIEREVCVEPLPGTSGDGLGWRTRMRYRVHDGRAGLLAHRSAHIVALPEGGCRIADPRGPHDEALQAYCADAGEEILVTTASSGASVFSDGRVLAGEEIVREQAGGHDFQVRADGFWQVHPGAASTFSRVVADSLEPEPGEVALDLYCGVGVFAAVLVDAGCRVHGVEADRQAISWARRNVPAAHFVVARVERAFHALPHRADLVVLDPPRTGAGKRVVAAIAALRPRRIGYVACDPAALARDLKAFARAGYRLNSLRVFDAFPMTHHMECIAIVEASGT